MLLTRTITPEDVKALNAAELLQLCDEVRQAILAQSAAIGGHVAPNLGIVELTVALHRVFNSPVDKIVFDVSHQTYTHKAITGRTAAFIDPTHYGEVSGFSNPSESEHDLFALGHTSTAVGLGCGLAKARDLAGDTYDVVAVIGDGALSGGLAFEGLDAAAELNSGLIIIVNDNDQSIAENHGGLYGSLQKLRATQGQAPDNFFRALGLEYLYLEDGNDVDVLVDALTALHGIDHPVVLHVHTAKGLGFTPAQENPEAWHHVGPFDIATGQKFAKHAKAPSAADAKSNNDAVEDAETYAEITGKHLLARMHEDRGVIAITAATPYVMGFTPERRAEAGAQFTDVGIAEEHAVTYATALAANGAKPVFGVYGVFLQRAYDELWHEMCLNDAPATLLVFGSSVYGTNAQTHLGYFDIPMLGNLPNMRYLAPTCTEEYLSMLNWALNDDTHPTAIRVPGAGVVSNPKLELDDDYSEPRYQTVIHGSQIAVLALGDFFALGQQVVERLATENVSATLINPRFATGLDAQALDELSRAHRVVITLEDGTVDGGWGEKVARYLGSTDVRVRCFGIAAGFPDRYDVDELLSSCGITVENIAAEALHLLNA